MSTGFFEQLYSNIVNYKVKTCCYFAPLKPGVLIMGYFDLIISAMMVMGSASETMEPLLLQVQLKLFDDSSAITSVASSLFEMAFSVVLLCGIHREDIKLMQVYTYFGLANIAKIVVQYSVVAIAISIVYTLVIVLSIAYQAYMVFLVRSAIIEIKQQKLLTTKNGYATYRTTNIRPNSSDTNNDTNELNKTQSDSVVLSVRDERVRTSEGVSPSEKVSPIKKVSSSDKASLNDKVIAKVEVIDEKKPEVKFDRVGRSALLARLSDKYKVDKNSNSDATKTKDGLKLDAAKNSGLTETIKATDGATASTSKEVVKVADKTKDKKEVEKPKDASKEMETISEEKQDENSGEAPVPKKRGFFRRSKPNQK